ncbi:hypothetical protein [Ligilactobacillus murinus]|uniref:hypothetical protein n=1 Tax=Ligilactobacillus murinus TaxID=1622 RepID=UPI0013D76DF0|nr:hypothetical protein [Ligilactobacillus murinus]MDE7023207.1 hypothetical protein [Ligilactobacillus sp.]
MDELSKMLDDFKEHSLKLVDIREKEIARREYQRGWNDGIKQAIEIAEKHSIGGKK